jgi:ERCC4-related helicase
MKLPRLIDNNLVSMADVINKIAPDFQHLDIATGYWDLPGTVEILDNIEKYKSIRLIIGLEPLKTRNQSFLKIDLNDQEFPFPEADIEQDLIAQGLDKSSDVYRDAAKRIKALIDTKVLQVKVFKHPRLHSKAYIFTDSDKTSGVGIVGSSNFTRAGLTTNSELNALEDDHRIIDFNPKIPEQGHGHLSWFNELWNHHEAIDWSGEFNKVIEQSPVGDLTYGPYDVYIRTLMEVYEDELKLPEELDQQTQDILFDFQNRNAGILINKLNRMGLAILADSVGLGKTITAGAVIKHYSDLSNANILVISPAALKQQWIDDLSRVLGIEKNEGLFDIISQQDINAIRRIVDHYNKEWRRSKQIDLIVIDEAHNLRGQSGARHEAILDLLLQHPDSKVLLLTATPINNSLLDIANQIQLGSKGKRNSVKVTYTRPDGKTKENIDFFDALQRIQSNIRKAQNKHEDVGPILERAKETIHEGLRYYLVRSTRQGVEAEGGIRLKDGSKRSFPVSKVQSVTYKYPETLEQLVFDEIGSEVTLTFEGIDPRNIHLLDMSQLTQHTSHPLDFMRAIKDLRESFIQDQFGEKTAQSIDQIYLPVKQKNLIQNILQCIYLLGFTPYRTNVYLHEYYGKSIEEIDSISKAPNNLKIQMAVHNILQITWLKRLESSSYALLKSIENYKKRILLFEKFLDQGYILTLSEAETVESEYGDDLDKAFDDYDDYLILIEDEVSLGKESKIKQIGIEKRDADSNKYNLLALKKDLSRDKRILDVLERILKEVVKPEHDPKLIGFKEKVLEFTQLHHGKKVLVFSFFADTIKYLEDNLPQLMAVAMPSFKKEAAFIHGNSRDVESIVGRFSPESKNYQFKSDETELNFLFSTDILSEGQNLQDAGILINYDLHWNPVRMIQRNGRINRLGSIYEEVLVGNMRPEENLEVYLKLINRLENKIKTIKGSVGLDQAVLDEDDVNPINFIERYYKEGELPDVDDDLLAHVDEHVIALREFMYKNRDNPIEVKRVQNIPLGKWNYLSNKSSFAKGSIALMKTKSEALESKTIIENTMFVQVNTHDSEYVTTYLDYSNALEYIKAKPEDNNKTLDTIQFDRLKVLNRAKAESKRQVSNPEDHFSLTPKYEKAVTIMLDHIDDNLDVRGILQQGITDIRIERNLKTVLNKIIKETKEKGTQLPDTVREFKLVLNQARKNISEEKEIKSVEGLLFYAEANTHV